MDGRKRLESFRKDNHKNICNLFADKTDVNKSPLLNNFNKPEGQIIGVPV